jgi:hypothetical protein
MKEICSASQQAVPTDLPFAVADYWEHNKGELVRRFAEVLRSAPVASAESPVLAKIVAGCQRALRRKLPRQYATVDPLPASVTEEVVERLARYNMRPVFLPCLEIAENLKLRNWVMPPAHFYQWVRDGRIAEDAATLRRGWYAADFTLGVDYTDGSQMMPDDPWVPLIMRLRAEGKVGKYDETPAGSRFSIVPKDEWETVLTYMAGELQFPRANVRLERYVEFNAVGNLYDPNRGRFGMWEWFSDTFEDSDRLFGGSRAFGGLASVNCHWSDDRRGSTAGRPLVVL